jgi:hypothetical protein
VGTWLAPGAYTHFSIWVPITRLVGGLSSEILTSSVDWESVTHHQGGRKDDIADFTPTSRIAWTQNHGFAMGMEVSFTEPGTPVVAETVQNVPFSIQELQIFGGTLTH